MLTSGDHLRLHLRSLGGQFQGDGRLQGSRSDALLSMSRIEHTARTDDESTSVRAHLAHPGVSSLMPSLDHDWGRRYDD